MGFWFAEERKAEARPKAPQKQRLENIPVETLRRMGCAACPRDKDRALRSPKMAPSGRGRGVLVLWGALAPEDDLEGEHLSDRFGREVERVLGREFYARECSAMGVLQCAGPAEPTLAELECCRPRGHAEVARIAPLVVVTVGDDAYRWATGDTSTALPHRGELFAARVGSHECWVYPVLYPSYLERKGGRGEYKLALAHDLRRLREMYEAGELDEPPRVARAPYDAGIEVITGQEPGDMQRLERALREIAREPRCAVDIETNCLRPFASTRSQMLTAACGTFSRTVAFALDHPDGWGSAAQRGRAHGLFHDFLADSGDKACHQLGFEMEWFAWAGLSHLLRRTGWDDTMAAAYVLDERPGTKGLGMVTLRLFGFDVKKQSRVDPKRILEYPIREALLYNGMDAKWTDAARTALMPQVEREGMRDLYDALVALAPTLVLTTAKGLPVDQGFADKASARLAEEMREIEGRLRRDADVLDYERRHGRFEPTNPDHLLRLLKDMGRREVLVEDRKDGTTKESTSEEVLLAIGSEVPACGLTLEHRSVSKLKGTYVDPTAKGENVCPDGRIRSTYNSMRTVTTRLSADDPAVQNWPKRKHKWVRAMIGTHTMQEAREYAAQRERLRRWFVALDYGQIEFRVVGMASGDPNLVRYCWTGYDVHRAWALRLMEVYPEVVDWLLDEFAEALGAARSKGKAAGFDEDAFLLKTLRQEMKNKWVFPQLFGSSTESCARNLHLPDDVTRRLGGEFWDEFGGVKDWQEEVLAGYRKHLYVETLDGARRRGPMSANEAINMPVQGTAAAIVKAGMTALSVLAEELGDEELQPNLNVHDDLSTIMEDGPQMSGKIDLMARVMCEHRFDFINVPLIVEASVGPNWADLEEVRVYKSHELFNLRNPYA